MPDADAPPDAAPDPEGPADHDAAGDGLVVYWRPGCGFCALLRRGLRRSGLRYEEVDIWADPAAAAVVRGVNGGDETVPTVVLRGRSLTNPSTREVLALVAEVAPELLPRD